jgi:hypothetical protein
MEEVHVYLNPAQTYRLSHVNLRRLHLRLNMPPIVFLLCTTSALTPTTAPAPLTLRPLAPPPHLLQHLALLHWPRRLPFSGPIAALPASQKSRILTRGAVNTIDDNCQTVIWRHPHRPITPSAPPPCLATLLSLISSWKDFPIQIHLVTRFLSASGNELEGKLSPYHIQQAPVRTT